MKYQDRSKAKRKYKQALFATVATMTLGTSFGGSITAFAAEKAPETQKTESSIPLPKASSTQVQDALDKINNLDKAFGTNSYDASVKQVREITPDIWKMIKTDNLIPEERLNNIAKNLVMSGLEMIPGVGGIASTIVGLFWPGLGTDPMKVLEDKLTALINTTVSASEQNDIKANIKVATDNLRSLDGLLKEETGKSSYYSADMAKTYVTAINTALKTVIEKVGGSQYKVDELPLYTAAATLRLTLLKFVETNAKNPELNMSDSDVYSLVNDGTGSIKATAIKYRDFIDKNVQDKEQKLQDDFKAANGYPGKGVDQNPSIFYNFAIETNENQAFKDISTVAIGKEDPLNIPINQNTSLNVGDKVLQCKFQWVNKDQNIIAIQSISDLTYLTFNSGNLTTGRSDIPNTLENINKSVFNIERNNFAQFSAKDTSSNMTWVKLMPYKDDNGNVIKDKYTMKAVYSYQNAYITYDSKENKLNGIGRKINDQSIFTIHSTSSDDSKSDDSKNTTPSNQPITDGTYEISTTLDSSKMIGLDKDNFYASLSNHDSSKTYWKMQFDQKQQAYHIVYDGTNSSLAGKILYGYENGNPMLTSNTEAPDQYWVLASAGNDQYYIQNKANPNLVLDVTGGKKDIGTMLQVIKKNNTDSQKFKFIKTK